MEFEEVHLAGPQADLEKWLLTDIILYTVHIFQGVIAMKYSPLMTSQL